MFSSLKWPLAALAVAVLAGCGGGSADTTPRTSVTTVKVFGDSLADSGTFGIKFTVQSPASLIYPELVAQTYGAPQPCNFFSFTGTTFAPNATAGCNNFAIGGGVINNAGSGLAAADPRGVGVQLTTAVAARGNFSAGDLLVIDGGGNDAAALVGAYVNAARDGGKAYQGILSTLLLTTQMAPIAQACAAPASAACQQALAAAGGTYMQGLADLFHAQIKTGALDKGAQKVVVLNMPGITNTPRFQFVLDAIAAANGGGTAGATARAGALALFDGWVKAFNAQLVTRFAGNSNVVLVDFYTAFNDEIAAPAQYGLTNVKTPACPITGVGSDGLPAYNFATCTAQALSAAPPAGTTDPNWWKSYLFSDSFHPTPYVHSLIAQLISRSLAQAGWL